nr:hypothetical protein GCM10020093_039940 [Planobispora longispora]
MRLAAPAHLVDINRLTDLAAVEEEPGGLRVGALARHSRVERSARAAEVQPLLGQALRLVAHPVIRNRGTVVGSLVHADPAAELPAVLALLGGSVRLARRGGTRDVPAAGFFTGPLESAAGPGNWPSPPSSPRWPRARAPPSTRWPGGTATTPWPGSRPWSAWTTTCASASPGWRA